MEGLEEKLQAVLSLPWRNDVVVSSEEEAVAKGMSLRPRFSPGYGDLPLTVQKEFMTLLDCAHLIGINLNESLLMSPSKSVTAIIGMK